jgi:hypothetical protein
MGIPKELYAPDLVDYCFDHFQNMAPLFRWVREVTRTTERARGTI